MTNKIPTGRFVWFEYVSKDLKKAQGFFGELFNWTTQDVPMPQGAYTMIASATRRSAATDADPMTGAPRCARGSRTSRSRCRGDARSRSSRSAARSARSAFKVGDVGTMASSPIRSAPRSRCGSRRSREPGGDYAGKAGSFCWNELYTERPRRVGEVLPGDRRLRASRRWRCPAWAPTTCSRPTASRAPAS